ncbi:MAG: shikimate dehydrogenase [Actinomycetota bacterium]|nr:shikimate dehydrogenase [Actinomycetota bacterium]
MSSNEDGALHQSWAWPTGTTRVAAVIGDPVSHSLSPVLHNAAIRRLGLDMVVVAFRTTKAGIGTAMAAAREFGLAGLMVTMPHKQSIIDHLDAVSERSQRLQSVNYVYWEGDKLVGDSADGIALINSLRTDFDVSIRGKAVALLGSGGAARSIALAAAEAGAASVCVISRNLQTASAAADLAGSVGYVGVAADAAQADVVINATPVGMAGTSVAGLSPVGVDYLHQGQFVYDIVYNPLVTPLMELAAAKGIPAGNGVGMLVHAVATAFEAWTGIAAPLEEMQAAARAETLRRL